MQTQDETLRKLIELTMMKLQNEDISEEIAAFDREDVREEIKILLGLLKSFWESMFYALLSILKNQRFHPFY